MIGLQFWGPVALAMSGVIGLAGVLVLIWRRKVREPFDELTGEVDREP